jgi:tetratricopeptide (TPR) repeat protein
MQYEQMKVMIGDVIEAGGFPEDEPLDSIARIMESPDHHPTALEISAYFTVLANFSEWNRAEAVARRIADHEDEKGQALASLSQKLADAGFTDRAEDVARSIPIDNNLTSVIVEQAFAFIKIAAQLVKGGHNDRAGRLLLDAEALVASRKPVDDIKASLLDDIAYTWKEINRPDQYLRLWDDAIAVAKESIRIYRAGGAPDVDSWKSLNSIAFGLSEAGEAEKARSALEAIDNEAWRQERIERMQKRRS